MIGELFVLGFAAVLGYAVSEGIDGHMSPGPGVPSKPPGTGQDDPHPLPLPPLPPGMSSGAPELVGTPSPGGLLSLASCEEIFDAIPDTGSDIANPKNAAKLAWKYGSAADLINAAKACDAVGATHAAKCLRDRADVVASTAAPKVPGF